MNHKSRPFEVCSLRIMRYFGLTSKNSKFPGVKWFLTLAVLVLLSCGNGYGFDAMEPLKMVANPAQPSAQPGQEAKSTITISGGVAPYAVEVTKGVGSVQSEGSQGDVWRYAYSIPATAKISDYYDATVTATDSVRNVATVQIRSTVPASPIKASPESLVLGVARTNTGTAQFTLSGGYGSYLVESQPTKGTLSISGNIGTYRIVIDETAAVGSTIDDTMVIKDAAGNSPISITAKTTVIPRDPGKDFRPLPDKSNLDGTPGQQVKTTITIEGGNKPYETVFIAQSTLTGRAGTTLDFAGSTATYLLSIPAQAELNTKITEEVQVKDADGNLSTIAQITTNVGTPTIENNSSLTGNEKAVARTMDKIQPKLAALPNPSAGQKALLNQINAINAASEVEQVEALNQITPDEAGSQGTVTTRTAAQQLSNVALRLVNLRAGATGFSGSGLSFDSSGQTKMAGLLKDMAATKLTGGNAGADEIKLIENLGVFVNGRFNFGNQDTTRNQTGFDFNTLGVTAGLDYRFTKDLILGLAGGYANTDIDFDGNGGNLDVNAWSLSFYGNYFLFENFYLDGIFNYGWNNYDQKRNISYSIPGAAVNAKQTADYGGNQYAFSFGGGYDFHFNAWTLNLNTRMNYTNLDVNGYREKDPNNTGLNLNIRDQSVDSLTTTLGTQASYAISTQVGIFSPKLGVEWEHEFKDNAYYITGSFVNDPDPLNPTTFQIITDSPTRDYFRLSPGLAMTFPHGVSGFLNWDVLLGYDNFNSNNFTFGVRYEF